jgi:catalase-peroxidase
MTTSQDWWPADYGHYGPMFIRMAWHRREPTGSATVGAARVPATTVRTVEQLAGQRQPGQGPPAAVAGKQKYGGKLSWADLLVFAGNCALESMGLQPYGFGGGREDVWETEQVDGARGHLARRPELPG